MQIRRAEPQDYDRIIRVVDAWWGGRSMQLMLPRLFLNHFAQTSLVADEGGDLRGFLVGFLSPSADEGAYVHFIGVHPDERGSGLGRALYERFFVLAAAADRRVVRCLTGPSNRASIAFHRRLGFTLVPGGDEVDGVPVHRDYDGPGEDRVLFVRTLP